jgi:hypothetical protein
LIADPVQVQQQFAAVKGIVPADAWELLNERLRSVTSTSTTSLGWGVARGILIALWSAGVTEGRWRSAPRVAAKPVWGVSAVRASLGYQPGGFAVGSALMPSTNVDAQAVATSVRYFSLTLSTQPASMTKSAR